MKSIKMTKFLALDPGNEETGYVLLDSSIPTIIDKGKLSNLALKDYFHNLLIPSLGDYEAAIETPSSYGMAVGQSLLDTSCWVGIFKNFLEESVLNPPKSISLIFRKTVKMHHCQSVRANDGEVNQSIKNKYGEDSTIKNPNEFYITPNKTWMNGDIFAALALALYLSEPKDYPIMNIQEREEEKLAKSLLMTTEDHIRYLEELKEKKKLLAKANKK